MAPSVGQSEAKLSFMESRLGPPPPPPTSLPPGVIVWLLRLLFRHSDFDGLRAAQAWSRSNPSPDQDAVDDLLQHLISVLRANPRPLPQLLPAHLGRL